MKMFVFSKGKGYGQSPLCYTSTVLLCVMMLLLAHGACQTTGIDDYANNCLYLRKDFRELSREATDVVYNVTADFILLKRNSAVLQILPCSSALGQMLSCGSYQNDDIAICYNDRVYGTRSEIKSVDWNPWNETLSILYGNSISQDLPEGCTQSTMLRYVCNTGNAGKDSGTVVRRLSTPSGGCRDEMDSQLEILWYTDLACDSSFWYLPKVVPYATTVFATVSYFALCITLAVTAVTLIITIISWILVEHIRRRHGR